MEYTPTETWQSFVTNGVTLISFLGPGSAMIMTGAAAPSGTGHLFGLGDKIIAPAGMTVHYKTSTLPALGLGCSIVASPWGSDA